MVTPRKRDFPFVYRNIEPPYQLFYKTFELISVYHAIMEGKLTQ